MKFINSNEEKSNYQLFRKISRILSDKLNSIFSQLLGFKSDLIYQKLKFIFYFFRWLNSYKDLFNPKNTCGYCKSWMKYSTIEKSFQLPIYKFIETNDIRENKMSYIHFHEECHMIINNNII